VRVTLRDSLASLQEYFDMLNRAAKVREARKLDRMFPGADRTLPFRLGGKSYLFARMPDGKILVALNGRMLAKPPKHIVRFGRTMMARQDVDDVHRL
jgi:hypothetical protein